MTNFFDDESADGARLRDLTRDGGLGEIIDREVDRKTAPLQRERDAYREAAIELELQRRARVAAEADISAEADRRSSGRHLRAI